MKAMILAAGYGKRLYPLTAKTPKPLIEIDGEPLLVNLIKRLASQGFREIVVNVSYLAEKIIDCIGNGHHFGVSVVYSKEEKPLETGGGIYRALPLLGNEPFLVVNGDILTDYPFAKANAPLTKPAHLILIDQKIDGKSGDFALNDGLATLDGKKKYTFSGIAVYQPTFFDNCHAGSFSVTPLLKQFIQQKQVSAELYHGKWCDIGHISRLKPWL